MENVNSIIQSKKLFKSGETVGVAVSGGIDSMCLLHYLNENKERFDIEIVAVTIDHCIRDNSSNDCQFVLNYCRENRIRCHKFTVDAVKVSNDKAIGIEQAAREVRYGMFEALLKKGIVEKVALAHHLRDQAETILLNILRGAGISGASGMEYVRDKVYVRPFLNVSKDDIIRYAHSNEIPYVEDETNADSNYSRNFLRNKIMPLLRKRFPAVDQNIVNFGSACKEDDNFISNQVSFDAIITDGNTVRIPLNYFIYSSSITSRMIFHALDTINCIYDIERKHISAIKNLANAENGKKIDLPNHTTAIKEYEYITIVHKEKKVIAANYALKSGETDFAGLYKIFIKRTKSMQVKPGVLYMDTKSLPKTAVWRTRQAGDIFEKFGGGSKPLRTYLIEKKIPARLRDTLPVLADGKEVYCILGVEISDKAKVTPKTTMIYEVSSKAIK